MQHNNSKFTVTIIFILSLLLFPWQAYSQVFARDKYDIPAQPVSDALLELALERDLNLVYLANMTKSIQANPLSGHYTVAEALTILLDNTGLRASISNNRMIKIELVPKAQKPTSQKIKAVPVAKDPQPTVKTDIIEKSNIDKDHIEKIHVVAQLISRYNLGTTVSSTKTQRGFLTTPQIVNAIPESLARDIGARDYSEATQLASSVSFLERSAGVVEELRLRGFAYPSLKINGVGAHAYITPVDVAFIDNIEIAKGPGSVLFGRMEPGGIINMMLKTPFNSNNSFNLRYGDDDFQRAEFDLSFDATEDTSVRGIVFAQKSGSEETLDLDDAQGIMLGLAHRLENGSELNMHYRHESIDVLQQFGRPQEGFDDSVEVFVSEDDEIEFIPSRQRDLRSRLDEKRHSLNVSLNDWLMGDWSADIHLQYDQYEANSNLNYPVIENFELEIDGSVANSEELTFALLENDEFLAQVLQGLESVIIDDSNLRFENDPFQFDTQFFSAEFTLYNSLLTEQGQFEQLYGINVSYSEPETLIWQTHDSRSSFVPINQAETLFNSEEISSNVQDFNTGLFAQWVLTWHNFTAFLGARVDYLEYEANRDGVASKADFLESTFRIGAVYKLTDNNSLFFNYSESFTPQFGTQEIFQNNRITEENEEGEIVILNFARPAESQQIEAGFKQSFLNGRLQSSCAIFDIEKRNILSDILKQRSRGAECDLAGSINRDWHITIGLSHLNARINNSIFDDFKNKRPRMTPENSFRAWITHDIAQYTSLSHFGDFFGKNKWQPRIGIGFRHVGERYIDSENEELLESYNIVDIALFADYMDQMSFTLLMRNLFDKEYVEGAFNAIPAWTTAGQERTLEFHLNYQF